MSPRKLFEQELEELRQDVLQMAEWVQDGYDCLFAALEKKDGDQMRRYVRHDRTIEDMQRNIESQCLSLLTRQTPVARDLRTVSAALKVVTDLERIGDQAEDIAEIVISGQVNEGEELLRDMAASTIKMVTESVDAYVKHDTMLAEKVIAEDDIVDDWFDRVKHTLIRRMTTDPGEGERAVDLLMIAKYFERIGDHAVNVAQWVIFSVTGTHKEG